MVSKKTTIINQQGLHMRPASEFAKVVTKYDCNVILRINDRDFNGKSVMNIISSCAKYGTEVEIICDGPKEEEALKEAVALIESGFGE
ncbi:MAG: HPr family phosphocarrier protein [Lachnospiraceae bacterium]|nr:HPr family phosphocarrier protein [Lachnospiraceae bacterium]